MTFDLHDVKMVAIISMTLAIMLTMFWGCTIMEDANKINQMFYTNHQISVQCMNDYKVCTCDSRINNVELCANATVNMMKKMNWSGN